MRTYKLLLLGSLLLMMFSLCSCYSYNQYVGGSASRNQIFGDKTGKDRTDTTRAYQTEQLYGTVKHNNTSLELNQFISDQVTAMHGVNSAIVMTTDRRAYVAITIDNSATGTKGGKKETNNSGTSVGIYNLAEPSRDNANSNDLITGANSYETVQNHEALSHLFKQKIAEKVRYLQPSLMDVYISANRNFINQMNNYAQESWKGRSLQPYLAEFNTSVEQLFGTKQLPPSD